MVNSWENCKKWSCFYLYWQWMLLTGMEWTKREKNTTWPRLGIECFFSSLLLIHFSLVSNIHHQYINTQVYIFPHPLFLFVYRWIYVVVSFPLQYKWRILKFILGIKPLNTRYRIRKVMLGLDIIALYNIQDYLIVQP